MLTRRLALVVLLALPFVVASCKINTINYFPPKPANIRVANFVIGVPTLDVTANGQPAWSGVTSGNATAYSSFDNIRTTFIATQPGSTSQLASGTYDIEGEVSYTLLAYGASTSAGFLAMPDTPTSPGSGQLQARVANIAAIAASVDVYITAPADSIDEITPTYQNILYSSASSYRQLASGTYRIRMTPTGAKIPVLYDSGAVTLPAGNTYDFIVYGTGSGLLVGLSALQVNGGGATLAIPNTRARIKAVNLNVCDSCTATPASGAVNVLLDGTTIATALPYQGQTSSSVTSGTVTITSSYLTIAPGNHTVAFESVATPGAILGSTTATFAQASDTSVYLAGDGGPTSAHAIPDTNLPTAEVRVRYVNASPDAPALQITLADQPQVASLTTFAASGYFTAGIGKPTLVVKDAVTGTVLLTTTLDLSDKQGQTGTIYLIGPSTALKVFSTVDR